MTTSDSHHHTENPCLYEVISRIFPGHYLIFYSGPSGSPYY